MNLFDNPFYILGASTSDTRRRLHSLCNDKILLDSSGICNEALQILTHPIKRLNAELRWFPGCSAEEAAAALRRLQDYAKKTSCSISDLIYSQSNISCFSSLNQLMTLLPRIRDDELSETIMLAARLYDCISSQKTLYTINTARSDAGFPTIESERIIQDALCNYQDEVIAAFDLRISNMRPAEYSILINRIASFGVSPIIESVIRRYELSVAAQLDALYNEISQNADILVRSSVVEERHNSINLIKAAVIRWSSAIEPLQTYAFTIGCDSVTDKRENEMINKLFNCYIELEKENAFFEAREAIHILRLILPSYNKYDDLRKVIDSLLTTLDGILDKIHAKKADEFKRLSEQAWMEEQRRNDMQTRLRAKEAERLRKLRIAQKRREEDEDIRILQARYTQIKQKEKERQQQEAKDAKRSSLINEKSLLQTKRQKLGLFSIKEKKEINAAINNIDSKLASL